jgi:hypothetical protein
LLEGFTNKITEAEKTRIEILARDKGYFNFSNKYITYAPQTTLLEVWNNLKLINLVRCYQVFNPDGKKNSHQKFTVEEVTFQAIEYNSLLTKSVSDTVFNINGIKYITNDVKFRFKCVIDRRISTDQEVFTERPKFRKRNDKLTIESVFFCESAGLPKSPIQLHGLTILPFQRFLLWFHGKTWRSESFSGNNLILRDL